MVSGVMTFKNIKCDSKIFVEFIFKKLGHKELNEEHSTISIEDDAMNIGTLTDIYCTLDYFPDDNTVTWSFILDEDWDNILAFTDRALTKLIVKHNNKVYFPNDVAISSYNEMEEAISKFLKSTKNESFEEDDWEESNLYGGDLTYWIFPETTLPMNDEERKFKYGQFGYGKYIYTKEQLEDMKVFFKENIKEVFPKSVIKYVI